jgi:hypothetical protein
MGRWGWGVPSDGEFDGGRKIFSGGDRETFTDGDMGTWEG